MKAVIEGKTYNTETAEELGSWSNGLSRSDFKQLDEVLYKTSKGAYFLHGDGGPMTWCSQQHGDMVGGGEQIKVLTEASALQTLEDWGEVDAIEKHFSHMIEEA